MATVESQQNWLPYDRRSKGCSQGFCTIYCPQWCYALFPPPAPLSLAGADDDSGKALSPIVIAIISILATALLFVSYYIFVSKHSASLSFHRRSIHLEEPSATAVAAGEGVGGFHDDYHLPQSSELEEALINTVWRYKRGESLVEGTDCSVCLSEFREEESIRLLPKCSHAFHLQCIDTWLKSHPNCPLCRVNVMPETPAKSERESRIASALAAEQEQEQEIVVIIEDAERTEEEGHNETDIVEVGEEEDAGSHRRSLFIADELQVCMEEEYMEGKDCELAEGGGPWRRSEGERSTGGGRSRRLHCAMSPVRMKRSLSSGRSFFARQGRGRTSPIPI